MFQERVPSLTLPHTHFHSPSNQLFYSSHCIPLLVSTLFKNHLSLVLLIAFHQSHFFYSVLSILYPAFFCWRCSRLTHTYTHTHSLTLIFSGVEFCNSTLGVWQCPNRNGMREKQPLQGLDETADYFSRRLCQRAPSDS